MWGAPNSAVGNAAFIRYCRQPGTRIAKIMALIDQGWSDELIANTFDDGSGHYCTAQDIAVYRKAHDGKLTLGHVEDPRRGELYELIVVEKKTAKEAARMLHLDITTAYRWSKEYRPR